MSLFSKDVGIDLGTANTLVYMKGKGIIMREPSVVAVDTKSDEVRCVGAEAKAVIGRTPGSIVAVRPLKDGVIADFDITANMLETFLKKACGNSMFSRPRVVICIPSGVTEVERRAVREAALKAGARQVSVIEEPMAAAIGGDGTLRGAIAFQNEGINTICIPGTIDRDVACSEYTLGFDTAANTAMEAIDRIRDSSVSHGRCSVVEVMGRKRGYIALWAGMATSADAIIIPEKWDGDYDSIIDTIKAKHADGRNSYLVVVAEGVTDAPELAQMILDKTGIESRVSVLGYIQRGGQPTAKDRMYGSLMGAYAVDVLKKDKANRMIAIKNDILIDYDIKEAIDIQNNQIDSFQYELSKLLAE